MCDCQHCGREPPLGPANFPVALCSKTGEHLRAGGLTIRSFLIRFYERVKRWCQFAATMSLNISAAARLQSIETEFVELTKRHFPDLWRMYTSANGPAEKVVSEYLLGSSGLVVSGARGTIPAVYRLVENLLQEVESFWESVRDQLRESVSQRDRLGILVGDIDAVSVSYAETILDLGLYFDSLYLIEPMSVIAQRVRLEPGLMKGDEFSLTAFKLLAALLRVRELLEVLPPDSSDLIIAFVPIGGLEWGDATFSRIFGTATAHTDLLLSRTFDDEIRGPSDLIRRTKHLRMDQFESRVRSDATVASVLEGFESYEAFARAHSVNVLAPNAAILRKKLGDSFEYLHLYPDIQARMLSLESSEVFASWLGIDASTHPDKHPFNLDRVERNRACGARLGLREGEVAAHALLKGDLRWLLPDSLSDLKAFRDSHSLEGIRELFRAGRRTMQRAGAIDLQAASEEMITAVHDAVQGGLKELEQGRSSHTTRIGLRAIGLAGSVGLSVVTTAFSLPLALSVPLAALVPTWTAWDLKGAAADSLQREQELLRRPAFMLLNFMKRRELNCLPLRSDGRRLGDVLEL